MLNPLIERRDYGGYDQIEKQMIELNDNGVLPDSFNKSRIQNAHKEARNILAVAHDNEVLKLIADYNQKMI